MSPFPPRRPSFGGRPPSRAYPTIRPPAPASRPPPTPSTGADAAPEEPPAPVEGVVAPELRPEPWVQMKYYSFHPCIGRPFGNGLYNPRARVPLRVFHHGRDLVGEDHLQRLIDDAIDLRLKIFDLPAQTDAFRAIHSDGDSLSGLVVDRFDDVLSIELHSLGMAQRLPGWLPGLHARLGTRRAVVEVEDRIARLEGIVKPSLPRDDVRTIKIREHGIRYEVNLELGHKTGFFCDQRDNRRRIASFTRGARVLDLCCYTGGFSLAAKTLGGAEDVTGVDLDETAIAQAQRNANLNQARISWVHCDAFSYARQMQRNATQWDVVILDPPKLVLGRDDADEGVRKYEDLNQLAVRLVKPGGFFVTCSCSGLLSAEDFERIVSKSAHRAARPLQILDRTGAGPDHPVMSYAPDGRYLKVLWTRVK